MACRKVSNTAARILQVYVDSNKEQKILLRFSSVNPIFSDAGVSEYAKTCTTTLTGFLHWFNYSVEHFTCKFCSQIFWANLTKSHSMPKWRVSPSDRVSHGYKRGTQGGHNEAAFCTQPDSLDWALMKAPSKVYRNVNILIKLMLSSVRNCVCGALSTGIEDH